MIRLSTLTAGLTLGLVLAAGAAFAQTGKVTVVTSFSKDVTDPIKKAFEKAVPGATLEVQNRNTNAGVKFLEETKANNQVDLFWASAPDAFEVLKGKKLLSRLQAQGHRHPREGRLLSDQRPGRLLFRLRGLGLRHHVERALRARPTSCPSPRTGRTSPSRAYFDHVSIAAPSRSGTTHLTIETDPAGRRLGQGLAHHQGDGRQFPRRSPTAPSACPRRSIPARSASAS